MATSPRSYRCPSCNRTYTPILSYQRCVVCRDADGHLIETVHDDNVAVWNHKRAQELKASYAEFERRYALHCEKRQALGHGDPEEMGAFEARKVLAELRELEDAVAS